MFLLITTEKCIFSSTEMTSTLPDNPETSNAQQANTKPPKHLSEISALPDFTKELTSDILIMSDS